MATAVIMVKQWAEKNKDVVLNVLKSSYQASNQMKQYDSWKKRASETVAKTFNQENADYWYNMFKGEKGEKNGISYNMGGSRVFNLADANQYFGVTDGTNRYKAVYDQVSKYLKELNPGGFNQNVKRIVPYEEAVNLSLCNKDNYRRLKYLPCKINRMKRMSLSDDKQFLFFMTMRIQRVHHHKCGRLVCKLNYFKRFIHTWILFSSFPNGY